MLTGMSQWPSALVFFFVLFFFHTGADRSRTGLHRPIRFLSSSLKKMAFNGLMSLNR